MAYKKILVPLNGSELAEKALPYAKSIARLKKSQVVLFAVSLTIFAERRDRLFSSYLEVGAGELNKEGIKTATATGYGDVAKEIVKYANNNDIDLIVIATHGYSKAKKWMFGSITQKVLYGTEIPVLLIKSKSHEVSAEFKRILVPLDGSPFSESTLPYIVELAKKTNKEILLLNVCEPPIVPAYGLNPINPKWKKYRDDMWGEIEKLAKTYLEKTVTVLKKKGVKAESSVKRAQSGEVVKTIMQVSKEEHVDLVAIATQGYTSVNRSVYGSIANSIVEQLSQPILLIRPVTPLPPSHTENLIDDIWQSYIGSKV
jgi:nucleotide-binding universal stress UspA family protein